MARAMTTRVIATALCAAALLGSTTVMAQERPADVLAPTAATAPLEEQLRGGPIASPLSMRISAADLRRVEIEHTQSWTLFAWGAANVVQGAGTAIGALTSRTGVDERVAAFGITSASVGAVNLALALPWVLRMPSERTRAGRWSALNAQEFEREIERARDDARSASAFFALNTGLDVAYITAGALMLAMAERAESRSLTLSGVGISVLVQGAALLAFDAWGWAARNRDGDRLRDAARR
jgi:hypothetical protein